MHFDSQFSHCSLVWMSHSSVLNTKINNFHCRDLRIIYRDEISTFEELLKKDGTLPIHQKNIHYLVTEMYKIENELAPSFMKEIFTEKDLVETECIANNTRNRTSFYNYQNPSSSTWGLEWTKIMENGSQTYKGSSFT